MKNHQTFNFKFLRTNLLFIFSSSIALGTSGCSLLNSLTSKSFGSSSQTASGPTVTTTVPSVDAVVARIQKGLPNADPTTGNYAFVLNQVSSNLPNATDPTKASGLDQIPVLVYAACADVVANGAVLSTYQVDVNQPVATEMNQLVQAGIQMVNAHVGNLAASGTALNGQVNTLITQLINNDVGSGANTATVFVSVCLAANSFGVGMVGF